MRIEDLRPSLSRWSLASHGSDWWDRWQSRNLVRARRLATGEGGEGTGAWSAKAIQMQLERAQSAGRWHRWRLRGPPLVASGLLFAACIPTCALLLALPGSLTSASLRHRELADFLCATGSIFGLLGLLLAVLPTDHKVVRIATGVWGTLAGLSAFAAGANAVNLLLINVTTWDIPHGLIDVLITFYCLCLAFRLFRAAWRLATRAMLATGWHLAAEMFLLLGMAAIARVSLDVCEAHASHVTLWTQRSIFVLVAGSEAAACGGLLLWRPGLPRSLQEWLGAWGGAKWAAAGIASVLGGHEPDVVMAKARNRCRSVQLDKVQKEEFSCNEPVQKGLGLNKYTQHTQLGDIDAFISHSWHDEPEGKWAALQAWGDDFRARNGGRDPRIWIDKYCIDQTNIAEDLLCLPVFLAASGQLVILFGETFLDRLWCIMEVLTFLFMGGQIDNVQIRRISTTEVDTSKFDVEKATCTNDTDKQMLLAIVEAGFGGRSRFNRTVVTLMQRVESHVNDC